MEVWQFVLKVLLVFSLGAKYMDCSEFYSFTVKDLKGNVVPMNLFKGKLLLVVNVASECGYTDQHYKELVELQKIFQDNDFSVLAFPCNQFGSQEPMRNSAIGRFVREKYNVNFPVFSKVKVTGSDAHPLYKYLSKSIGKIPDWNFGKYLVNRAGKVVHFWSHSVSPLQISAFVKKRINMAMADQFEVYSVYNEL